MKKTLTILLVALMILSGVLSRAAVAEGEKNPEVLLTFGSIIH